MHPILIDGQWQAAQADSVFFATNPATRERLPDEYPLSNWADCDRALAAASRAFVEMQRLPSAHVADFLERYATLMESHAEELVAAAHAETGLPKAPRLSVAELPRTVNQLRQGAAAAREGSWALPTIDTKQNIRSCFAPIGPVCVFGPNNFPFAFNSIAGGDFVAAIAAGNPVIAKAHTSHPTTTRLLAELAAQAAKDAGLPKGAIQLLYRTSHADGERLVSDPRVAATGYTGSRHAGLKLKAAADRAGKPIYLELSSVNPVVILPGAISERSAALSEEFTTSCLMGAGQFCTNPGLVLLIAGPDTESFVQQVTEKFSAAPAGVLLSQGVVESLSAGIASWTKAGAKCLVGGKANDGPGIRYANTLARVSGGQFLKNPLELQAEAFGNASLFVVAEDVAQLAAVIGALEGNLTGCIYSHTGATDEATYVRIAPLLREKVGRLLNDKMPTGVAVSPAMNHGGPYPATGHSGFTAVGIPAALRRFAALHCYDNVRPTRLPVILQDGNSTNAWRSVDGEVTTKSIG